MLSLIIPVYKNAENIANLLNAIDGLACRIKEDFEAVFVVDGSPDNSYELLIEKLPSQSFSSQLVLLSRNFGSFAAIRAGMRASKGKYIAVMAADLQEPIDLIEKFFEALRSEACDVVVGTRLTRDDPYLTRINSTLFWNLYRKLVIKSIPEGGVDIFGCNRIFSNRLLSLNESNSSLVGLIYWLGFRRLEIPYSRQKREIGKSSWSFTKKLNYMLDSVFSFTDLPIRLLIGFGILGICISVIIGLLVVIFKFFNLIHVPGYSAIVVLVTFFGGLNSLGIGIIGNYTWRAYENTKNRPLFLESSTIAFTPSKL